MSIVKREVSLNLTIYLKGGGTKTVADSADSRAASVAWGQFKGGTMVEVPADGDCVDYIPHRSILYVTKCETVTTTSVEDANCVTVDSVW